MATRKIPASKRRARKHRKAPAPEFYEIDGHRLTPAMHEEYQAQLAERGEELALDSTLHPHRPSMAVKDQLHDTFSELTALALALQSLSQYPFFADDSPAVRTAGCAALIGLAQRLVRLAGITEAISSAIEAESKEHVQDWLARQADIDLMWRGRSAESTGDAS